MRVLYLAKLALKTSLILTAISLILISLYDSTRLKTENTKGKGKLSKLSFLWGESEIEPAQKIARVGFVDKNSIEENGNETDGSTQKIAQVDFVKNVKGSESEIDSTHNIPEFQFMDNLKAMESRAELTEPPPQKNVGVDFMDNSILNSISQTEPSQKIVQIDFVNNNNSLSVSEKEITNYVIKETLWEDQETNLKFNSRYWDLIKNSLSNPNGTIQTSKPTSSLMHDQLYNLWRPLDGKSSPGPNENDRIVPQIVWQMEALESSFAPKFKTKKIVIWDTFKWWNKPDWKGKSSHQLTQSDCKNTPGSLTQCIFTENINEVYDADAVIAARDSFHTGEVSVPDNVLKFYFILESQFHSWAMLNRSEDLLATYWRGSDLVTPYSKWVYHDLNVKSKPQETNYALGKTKPGAMFVSNCGSWNGRLDYIHELQKYIQIDVYGRCGTLTCERFKEGDCFKMLKKDYYFYFAFENSNCRDYITEKLFNNGLKNDLIPIALGAHPDDYKALAPENSYIHIEDFDSPEELAKYMKYLIDNPSEYNKYFEWKGTGEIISSDLFCRLCSMVHYADLVPPPKRKKTYRWGHVQAIDQGVCLGENKWYWTDKPKKVKLKKLI